MMQLYTSSGNIITIDDVSPLGKGVSGIAYSIISGPSNLTGKVVKIYHKDTKGKDYASINEERIKYMINNPPEKIEGERFLIAWPIDYVTDRNRQFRGFVMPRAFKDSISLQKLMPCPLRKTLGSDWRDIYELRRDGASALNLARMKLVCNMVLPIALMHRTGKYVLRDVKPDNILVTRNGKVTICDVDSIQITENGRLLYAAGQGTDGYMPPEFCNPILVKDKPIDVTWDNFAVAVMIYHIMTGIHPYSVVPRTGDNSIQSNISRNLFAYGTNRNQIEKINDAHRRALLLPKDIQKLFLLAFGPDPQKRPSVAIWGKAFWKIVTSIKIESPIKTGPPIKYPYGAFAANAYDEISQIELRQKEADGIRKPKTDIPTSQIEKPIQQPKRSRKGLWIALSGVALLVVALVIVLAAVKHKKSHPEEIVLENMEVEQAEAEDIEVEQAEAEDIEDAVKDYDGNTYKTVRIGNQVWMAENLRTKHYSDGEYISSGNGTSETTAYWYYPDGNSGNASRYGLLYNWKAVMRNASSSSSNPSGVQGICPNGWHVPSDAEWTQLENYVGSQSRYCCYDNEIAKALASTQGWESVTFPCAVGNDQSSNNATGFNAVPAGYYYGSFYNFRSQAKFWSATQDNSDDAYYWYLHYDGIFVYRNNGDKDYGYSVRCLRD